MPFECKFCQRAWSTKQARALHYKHNPRGECATFLINVDGSIPKQTRETEQSAVPARDSSTAFIQTVEAHHQQSNNLRDSNRSDKSADPSKPHIAESTAEGFNTVFELTKVFAEWNNGQGAALADQQLLLDLLHHPEFRVEDLPTRASDLREYGRRLVQEANTGWTNTELRLDSWPEPVQFRYRDPVRWLKDTFSKPALQDAITFSARPVYKNGIRVWSQPCDSDAWIAAQADVQEQHGKDSHVAALQFYSDKTSCNKTTQFYPFKCGLLNIDYALKVKNLGTLGFIPILRKRRGISSSKLRQAKRELMAKCLTLMLAPLRAASYTGLHVQTADSRTHSVFPRVLSYVADDPEQRAVLQLYVSGRCKRQCCRCYAHRKHMCDFNTSAQLRTLDSQQQIQQQIAAAPNRAAAIEICKKYSTHPDAIGLAGFAGEDSIACDPYQIFAYEFMHNWSLGVMELVVGGIKAYADRTINTRGAGRRVLDALDHRLQQVTRSEGLKLPTHPEYFSNPTNITANEHQAVAQVLPLLVHGLVDEELTRLVCIACDLGMRIYTRRREEEYTERDLVQVDKAIQQLYGTLERLYGDSSSLNTPKLHKLAHLTTDIRRLGHPKHYNSDFYEHSHVQIKRVYRLTSHKQQGDQYVHEVVNHLQLLEVLDSYAAVLSSGRKDDSKKQYLTALMATARTGAHTFSRTSVTISLEVLAGDRLAARIYPNQARARRSLDLLQWDKDSMRLLPHRIREFMLGDQVGYGNSYRRTQLPELQTDKIWVHHSAVLAAEVPWCPSYSRLQTIRAKDSFHNKPFFDNVAVRIATSSASSSNQVSTVAYAKLLLLLEVELPDRSQEEDEDRMQRRQLAYVRWYNVHRHSNHLTKHGAVLLSWDKTRDPAADNATRFRESLIPLESIIRRVHVVPDFSRLGVQQDSAPSRKRSKRGRKSWQSHSSEAGQASSLHADSTIDWFYVNPFKYAGNE